MRILTKLLTRFTFFSYNFQAPEYLENFLISAVASVVLIRVFLSLTGYPVLGNDFLHIAHMLWGGLLMMAALVTLLLFLNKEAKHLSAIVGGLGFGIFIDELGKFITHDNNYFFQPTFALLYLIFVLLFLVFRFIARNVKITDKDYKLNALELSKEVVFYNLDTQEKRLALHYLKSVKDKDEIYRHIKKLVSVAVTPDEEVQLVARVKHFLMQTYTSVLRKKRFAQLTSFIFAAYSSLRIFASILSIVWGGLSFWEWGSVGANMATGIFSLSGIWFLSQGKRLRAYEKFKQGVLVAIFIGHFFSFYHNQLTASLSLIITISIFIGLQFLIEQEEAFKHGKQLDAGKFTAYDKTS